MSQFLTAGPPTAGQIKFSVAPTAHFCGPLRYELVVCPVEFLRTPSVALACIAPFFCPRPGAQLCQTAPNQQIV